MRLKNQAACLRAEAFIRREVSPYRTVGLDVRLRFTKYRRAPVRGYFRGEGGRIAAAVNPSWKLPCILRYPVRTETFSSGQFRWIHDEERAADLDELMVWVFFHEFHHFLCHSGQRKGNWQTKANAFGFEFLRKFKAARIMASDSPGLVEKSPASLVPVE